MPPCRPTCVRLDGRWYDLSGWTHPGGQELIARQAGRDVTALFYANHFGNFSSKKALLARLITEGQESDSSLPPLVLQHCSPLYASLKAQVQTHLDKHGLAWRHRFRWEQTAFRFACLFLAWPLKSGGGWAGTAAACAYGLATGRATWTHVHNAVHNPSILPPAARAFSTRTTLAWCSPATCFRALPHSSVALPPKTACLTTLTLLRSLSYPPTLRSWQSLCG